MTSNKKECREWKKFFWLFFSLSLPLFCCIFCFSRRGVFEKKILEMELRWKIMNDGKTFCLFAPKPPPPLVKNQHQQWDNGDNKNKNNFATRKWNKIKSQSGHRKVILTDYRAMIIILMMTKNDDVILLGDFCINEN